MSPLLRKTPDARYRDAVWSLGFARARLNAAPGNVALRRDVRAWVRFALALRRAALLGWMNPLAFDEGEG
jgi:hypothetical protein